MARCLCDYDYMSKSHFEKCSSRSRTVPDQSLTIPEIFERMRCGMSLDTLDKGGYYDDPDCFDEDYDTCDTGFSDYTDIETGFEVND